MQIYPKPNIPQPGNFKKTYHLLLQNYRCSNNSQDHTIDAGLHSWELTVIVSAVWRSTRFIILTIPLKDTRFRINLFKADSNVEVIFYTYFRWDPARARDDVSNEQKLGLTFVRPLLLPPTYPKVSRPTGRTITFNRIHMAGNGSHALNPGINSKKMLFLNLI